jgi:hypothetical protein
MVADLADRLVSALGVWKSDRRDNTSEIEGYLMYIWHIWLDRSNLIVARVLPASLSSRHMLAEWRRAA